MAQEVVPSDPPVKPEKQAEDIDSIIKEHAEAKKLAAQKFHAAKTDEERQQLLKEWQSSETYAKRIMAVVKKDPKGAQAARGLLWVAVRGPENMKKDAADHLLEGYADSKEMIYYAYYLSESYKGGDVQLRKIIEKTTSKQVKRSAQMYLAAWMETEADMTKDEAKAKAIREEALAILREQVKLEKEDQSTPELLAELEEKLFQLERLSVGAEAPDIVGTDQDGKEFKLSDYRGKVILLDFWGYW